MKKIILLFLVSLPMFMCAQNNESHKIVYADIVGTTKFFSTSVTVQVDYGQDQGIFKPIAKLKDDLGKAISFNSMVDALNYMSSDGWHFVQAFAVTKGSENVYHFLVSKELTKDELVKMTIGKKINKAIEESK